MCYTPTNKLLGIPICREQGSEAVWQSGQSAGIEIHMWCVAVCNNVAYFVRSFALIW